MIIVRVKQYFRYFGHHPADSHLLLCVGTFFSRKLLFFILVFKQYQFIQIIFGWLLGVLFLSDMTWNNEFRYNSA